MSKATEIRYDAPGHPAVRQTGLNGFDLSYNPDDRKGLANARAFMRRNVPRNPERGGV